MEEKSFEEKHDPYAALKIPEFRLYVAARWCITIALQIQGVVVGWQIYQLTKDPLSLGLIGLAEALPAIIVALYAGYVADNYNRKNIILITVAMLVFCSAALWFYTIDLGAFLLKSGALPIYAVIFLSGIARGFMGPAVFSFMPQLMPDRRFYANAITWSSTTWQAASVAGPAIGGLVLGFWGISAAYATDASLTLTSLFFFGLIGAKALPHTTEKLSLKESLLSGIKFVFGNQLILGAISLDLFAVLFGGAVALLPIYTTDILKSGAESLGFLRAAPAIGSVLMAFYLAHRPIGRNAGKKMLLCVAGFGVCIILFGISTSFWFSLFMLALSGMFDSISVIIRSTLIHTYTPEHMKGRVSAVNNIFIGSSNEIGAFESGFMARLIGVVPSVVFGGIMTILVVAVTSAKADKLRKLEM